MASRYMSWSKETFPTAIQAEFLPLAERCIQTFWTHSTIKLDARFLRVLLQYADLVNNSLEIYAGMEQNGIGLQSVLFWKARGRAYEAREDWNNAEAMYQKGVDSLAKPIEMMKSIQTEFEARMFRRLKAEAAALKNGTATAATATAPAANEAFDENRAPLSTLTSRSSDGARGLGPSGRPVVPINGAAPLAANNKKRSSDQLQIFVDDEFATESEKRSRKPPADSAPAAAPVVVVGNLAVESKKENQREVEMWINNTLPQDSRALAAVARVSKQAGSSRPQQLQVFEDAPSDSENASSTSTSSTKRSTAFKMRDGTRLPRGVPGSSSAPYRFTIKSEFYPRGSNEPTVTSTGGLEKAVYDRTTVFPGDGKEYSFEEIRAKFYAERAASQNNADNASSAPSATLQEESSQMVGQEPMEPTPSPQQTVQQVASPQALKQQSVPASSAQTNPTNNQVFEVYADPEEPVAQPEEKEKSTVAEDASASSLASSNKSLIAEFESATDIKVNDSALDRSTKAVDDEDTGRLAMQSLSDAIVEPLITAPLSQFVIHEDEDSQEDVDTQNKEEEGQPIRALQPRSSTAPAPPKRSSSIHSTSRSGDENDPSVWADFEASKPTPSSTQDEIVPFEDAAPMTPAAPQTAQITSPPACYEDPENMPPKTIISTAAAPAADSIAAAKPRSRGLSMQSVSDLIQSEAEVVQRREEEEAEQWSYNPDDNATMSGVTRRTKDAMDEVMGMFQFDKTMTGIPSSVDFDGNYEVTASIVIPFEHVNKAMQKNDFAIFMDVPSDDVQVESPAPVSRPRSSFAPSQDLLIVPYQDDENVAPSSSTAPIVFADENAMAGVQQLAPVAPSFPSNAVLSADFEVFADPETPKPTAPSSRLGGLAPASSVSSFEVFADPETPKAASFSAPSASESASPLVDVDTPPAPSRLSLILERTVEDETPEEEVTLGLQNTSTLNFTMSGITMSGTDTTTINTQNLGNIIARSNSAKKVNRPVYYTLTLQNPVVDPSSGEIAQKLELTSTIETASGPALLAQVPQWSSVPQLEQLNLMRDTGIEGIVELLNLNAPFADSFQDGASVAFGDDSYLVLQRMAQVGADSYVYMLESEAGETVLAQRGDLYDFWACKRLFTKLNSAASSSNALSSVAIEDLYSSLIDYSKAYVFGNCTWLFWPLKSAASGSKSQAIPSTTLEKSFANSLEQVVAMRDPKGYDEIVVWYFAQRLARLQHALHALGFVAGGRLMTSDLFACSPAMDAAVPFIGSRGLVLHRYSSLVDVESYTEGTLFAHGGAAATDARVASAAALIDSLLGSNSAWTVEPDMAKTAMIVHSLLHGKDMALESTAGGRWKTKMAPKMFWNVSLWNAFFDTMLNGSTQTDRIEAQSAVCAQVDTYIAAKGTALRFQMGKLNF